LGCELGVVSDVKVNEVAQKVLDAAKKSLGDKLEKVVLFGSYARGDYDEDSDVNFFILANVPQEEANKWRGEIRKKLPGIDLEYDLLISLHVTGTEIFYKFRDVLPFYSNIAQEGVEIVA